MSKFEAPLGIRDGKRIVARDFLSKRDIEYLKEWSEIEDFGGRLTPLVCPMGKEIDAKSDFVIMKWKIHGNDSSFSGYAISKEGIVYEGFFVSTSSKKVREEGDESPFYESSDKQAFYLVEFPGKRPGYFSTKELMWWSWGGSGYEATRDADPLLYGEIDSPV